MLHALVVPSGKEKILLNLEVKKKKNNQRWEIRGFHI
jgi:hypothetical protein